ncbi:MMPL family transporter [Nocardia abscessus]|uniref:MMPL family transporter n=1 Tax=Nocardia TaxID=1817 RepID=UPI00189558EF|nr:MULTISPECIES: MMPL family transporter [Nocardia]MBF6222230.1 MMPL family transporter [Nocardia abscessus]MDE1672610.1 MMPL family transporter [Nocardia gipuzkoensis]
MLVGLTRLAVRRPRSILYGALLVGFVCVALGWSAPAHLKSGGYIPSDTESAEVAALLNRDFPGAAPNLVLLVTAPDGLDSPAARATGERLTADLRGRGEIDAVQSYWELPPDLRQALRGNDGRSGLVLAHVTGDDTDAPKRAGAIAEQLSGEVADVTVRAGGQAVAFDEMSHRIVTDLLITEAIAVPLTGLALILVFGSVTAALIPLAVGVFNIFATLPILRLLTEVGDVSIFALNMMSALGFAVAIDSSLFMVSRFREELAGGSDTAAAVSRTARTAGRTVLFSGVVIALSLSTLLIFPLYFLRSLAYAGLAVLGAAVFTTLLLVPAALALLGPRVDALDLRIPLRRRFRLPSPRPVEVTETRWYRTVRLVMRRPVPAALAVIALLLVLGSPFLSIRFGAADDRVISGASSHEVGDALRTDFRENAMAGVLVALPEYRGGDAEISAYAERLSQIDGVTSVLSAAGVYIGGLRVAAAPPGMRNDAGAYLRLGTRLDPYSAAAIDQLDQVRSVPAPGRALLGGAAAESVDALDALAAKIPLAVVVIALSTLVVLFFFTGSVLLPVKALLLNTLSLAATFGAMVWVFQEGHLSGLLGFTPTGYLVPTMPILMFCIAFGVSMDYEVFLLSRIREEWLASGDNTRAVATGVARTARIFTAAACLMAIAFAGMVTSHVSFIQLFGLGLTLAVLTDATLIRGVLAPALMRLLGSANWWAPRRLARLHERIEIPETSAALEPVPK